MSCPRPGKECNEFMCGNSVEGVCREGLKDYKVITLCGSTKFKDEFMKVQKELTLNGYIGNSTKSEIEYTETHNKKLNYLVDNK